ncbi:unnamed protein product, partial [Ixodes persulcatus]
LSGIIASADPADVLPQRLADLRRPPGNQPPAREQGTVNLVLPAAAGLRGEKSQGPGVRRPERSPRGRRRWARRHRGFSSAGPDGSCSGDPSGSSHRSIFHLCSAARPPRTRTEWPPGHA